MSTSYGRTPRSSDRQELERQLERHELEERRQDLVVRRARLRVELGERRARLLVYLIGSLTLNLVVIDNAVRGHTWRVSAAGLVTLTTLLVGSRQARRWKQG
jgi:hypothetical protein